MAIKVSQAVIDEIKKKGMGKSISEANSGNASKEFVEGAKRMYGKRVSGQIAGDVRATDTENEGKEPKSVPMPASAPAAASRASKPKGMVEALGGSSPKPSGPKKPTAFEKISKQNNTKNVVSNLTGKKKDKDSKLKEQYAEQKKGSKFKGAFSGLGG